MTRCEIIDWIILTCFGLFFAFILGNMTVKEIPPVIQEVKIVNPVDECKKSRECRNLAIGGYFEARGESDVGVVAVMSVVLNRKHRNEWPNTVEKVLKYRCQFSYTCDGSLSKANNDKKQWERMYELAYKVIHYGVPTYFQDLTHFHTTNVKPYWTKQYNLVTTIGKHKFYKCNKEC